MKSNVERMLVYDGIRCSVRGAVVRRRQNYARYTQLRVEKLESRMLLAVDLALDVAPLEGSPDETTEMVLLAASASPTGDGSGGQTMSASNAGGAIPSDVSGPVVDMILTLTALDGSPLSSIAAGEEFVLHVHVEDLRDEPAGVYAGFLDVQWDSGLAVASGPIEHDDLFPNFRRGDDSAAGLIDEAGAVGDGNLLGGGRYELFRVRMQAIAAGELSFAADSTERLPLHDILVFGWNVPVPQDLVRYGSASLTVEGTYDGPIGNSGGDGGQGGSDNQVLSGPTVEVILQITDAHGSPLTELSPGQDFVLHVYLRDLRATPKGIFAGYVDITWDSALAVAAGAMEYGSAYANVQSGSVATAGLLDEAGAVAGLQELGGGSHLLLSIPLQAVGVGGLVIQAGPADLTPLHDVLAYGWDVPIPQEWVIYGSIAVVVSAGTGASSDVQFWLLLDESESSSTGVSPASSIAGPISPIDYRNLLAAFNAIQSLISGDGKDDVDFLLIVANDREQADNQLDSGLDQSSASDLGFLPGS